MNLLNKTKLYQIGPMQYENGQLWREETSVWLKEMGITVLNPYDSPFLFAPSESQNEHQILNQKLSEGDFRYVADHMKQIVRFDLACVDRSDILLVYVNPSVHTCGSYHELFLANSLKKPIFIVVEGGKEKCPLWLFGVFPDRYIYSSFDEVKTMLQKINSGEIVPDSNRWRLLKPIFR